MNNKIISFTDLIVWQEAHKLALSIYELTKKFPKEEIYSLTDQIKRASISITSNIAEGFSRQNSKEKIQFYYIAMGSLTEVQNQLIFAKDTGFISQDEYLKTLENIILVHKLLNGLIRSIKQKL